MKNDEWNNRNRREYTNDRDQRYGNDRRVDEDSYRGAYRLDTTSDHRNQTTWDSFGRGDSNRWQNDYNQDFNRNYNRNYNNEYNRNYNSSQQSNRNESNRGSGYNADFDRDNPDWNERFQQYQSSYGNRSYDDGSGRHESVRSRIQDSDRYGAGNFNSNYSPDNYGGSRGENYGNMAGSLSFGYDGIGNADHDQNRHYDPQSGRHRSYHGNYESRWPASNRFNDSRNDSSRSNDDWI